MSAAATKSQQRPPEQPSEQPQPEKPELEQQQQNQDKQDGAATAAASGAVSFKKRAKGARKGKLRSPVDSPPLGEDGSTAAVAAADADVPVAAGEEGSSAVVTGDEAEAAQPRGVDAVKEMQEFRRRERLKRTGITLNSSQTLEEQLMVLQGKDPESLYADERASAADLQDRIKIGGSFREGSAAGPKDAALDPVTKQMEEYIAKKLAEKLPAIGASDEGVLTRLLPGEEESKSQAPKTEDDLFDGLLTRKERERAGKLESESAIIDSLESGARWLTGIQEINLPVKYKLENIERTELARAKLLAGQKRNYSQRRQDDGPDLGPDMRIQDLPSNFNADYKRHRREWYQNLPDNRQRQLLREQQQKEQAAAGGGGAGGDRNRHGGGPHHHHQQNFLPKWQQASDDRVASRFVKAERARSKF